MKNYRREKKETLSFDKLRKINFVYCLFDHLAMLQIKWTTFCDTFVTQLNLLRAIEWGEGEK